MKVVIGCLGLALLAAVAAASAVYRDAHIEPNDGSDE